jgi:hypothetical protein
MAIIKLPPNAKLFTGIIYRDEKECETAINTLVRKYGRLDCSAGPFPFGHTEYYREMGSGLNKRFISFEELIEREAIIDVKLFANDVEVEISGGTNRIINIDPGYLTLSNMYLASCKEYYHRIYLGKGVHLENEYYYKKGKWEFFEWTYPDYKTEQYLAFFYQLRRMYKKAVTQIVNE